MNVREYQRREYQKQRDCERKIKLASEWIFSCALELAIITAYGCINGVGIIIPCLQIAALVNRRLG